MGVRALAEVNDEHRCTNSSVVLDQSWNEDAGHFRRDRGAEQETYQADTPLWSNEEHGEKAQVFVSRLVQQETQGCCRGDRTAIRAERMRSQ